MHVVKSGHNSRDVNFCNADARLDKSSQALIDSGLFCRASGSADFSLILRHLYCHLTSIKDARLSERVLRRANDSETGGCHDSMGGSYDLTALAELCPADNQSFGFVHLSNMSMHLRERGETCLHQRCPSLHQTSSSGSPAPCAQSSS